MEITSKYEWWGMCTSYSVLSIFILEPFQNLAVWEDLFLDHIKKNISYM